jgi:hypothetical protein
MLFFGLILLFLYFEKVKNLVSQTVCPQYTCSSSYNTEYDGLCYNSTFTTISSMVQITPCPTNQYCNYNPNVVNKKNTTINCTMIPLNIWSGLPTGKLVEQDYCIDTSDCIGKNCTNNTCYGYDIGYPCSNTTSCAAGSYCNLLNRTCSKQVNAGEKCLSDDNCVNNAGCLKGVCTPLYSVPSGISIGSNNSIDGNNFCISGYVNNQGVCEDLVINGDFPYYCDPTYPCNYTTSLTKSKVSLMGLCTCDLNGNGYAFCRMSTNSTSYISYNKVLIASINNTCHFYNKKGCALSDRNVLSLLSTSKNTINGVMLSSTQISACLSPLNIDMNPATCLKGPCGNLTNSTNSTTNSEKMRLIPLSLIFFIISLIFI